MGWQNTLGSYYGISLGTIVGNRDRNILWICDRLILGLSLGNPIGNDDDNTIDISDWPSNGKIH